MEVTKNPALPLLLVDDEPPWLRGMTIALARSLGIDHVITCADSREVMAILAKQPLSGVMLDVTMPFFTGEELLARIVEEHPGLPVIMLTGRNQLEIAVRCMKLGAFDYFVKTDDEDRIMTGVRRALELAQLRDENLHLRESLLSPELRHPECFAPILTRNRNMQDVFRYIEAIAASPEPVLITGESGTGKELIARAIHATSKPAGPWVAVNAAGLDDQVFSDTLFGHRRGAFTGANEHRGGMIEKASGGVLFLDEIGDLSAASQVKLLRLLQEGEYYPIGSDHPSRLNARLVFATNHDLDQLQVTGAFRKDLFHRLRAHRIHLPPLRERSEDLPLLLDHFLATAAAALGKKTPTPPPELATLLRTYPFPGNLRELRAMVIDAVSRHESKKLSMDSFKAAIDSAGAGMEVAALREGHGKNQLFRDCVQLPTLAQATDGLIAESLRRADGKLSLAARLLGISRPALSKRLLLKGRKNDLP